MAVYEEINSKIREAYIRVRDYGLLDRLEELGLPSIEDVSYMEDSLVNTTNLMFLENKIILCNNIPHNIANSLMILYLSGIGNNGYLVEDCNTFAVFDNVVNCEKPILKYRYSTRNPRRCDNGMTLVELELVYNISHSTLVRRYDAGARSLDELLRGASKRGAK